jgi:6-pyruvoyltetrahydropterin/6-carboxytetrahydropterin synthase
MHRLSRQVRFSVNPFLSDVGEGYNSYASRPCGEGLCLYFGLWVELAGAVDDDTGFVVNVVEIDRAVRRFVVPIFVEGIRGRFGAGEHVGLSEVCGYLQAGWGGICDKFGSARLMRLCLELNPFRKLAIESEDSEMVYFSEKFEFAATHTLWNDKFSKEKNLEVFGKCANPAGHGHNYVVEVTVRGGVDGRVCGIGSFERVVEEEFIQIVDHKNLNIDIEAFGDMTTTVENISSFAWERLAGKFGDAELAEITIWETEKTYCRVTGATA